MKKREDDISKREEELKEREQRALELKLKISQSSFKFNNGLYQSMEKGFDKTPLLDDYQKENISLNVNQSLKLAKINGKIVRDQSSKSFKQGGVMGSDNGK